MNLLLAAALGVIFPLGFAPFDLWPATFMSLAGFFWLLERTPRPILAAWVFGLGKYGLGASWIYVSINVYGNAPPPLAAALVGIFVASMAALFVLPVGWMYSQLRGGKIWERVLLFGACWGVMDWALTWLLTGFPWLFPGYAFMETPVMGFAPLAGVLGIGFLIAVSAAAAGALIFVRDLRVVMIALGSLPWLFGWGLSHVTWVEDGAVRKVALVQGNLDQAIKWNVDQRSANVAKHIDLSEEHWDVDLMVWPEAAITMYPQQAQDLLEYLSRRGHSTNTNLVVGIPGARQLPDGNFGFENLAMGLGLADGRFAKQHLVPFGEYVPFEDVLRGLIEFFDLPMSNAVSGASDQRNIRLAFGEAALAICYEIAYPESMRQRGASADVLITISNDTWFGESIGPHQHMQIARMRAAENGRWLLRGTNNGITAIVNARGEIVEQLPQFVAATLRGEMRVMKGKTPFSLVGDWPTLASIVLVLGFMLWFKGRREMKGDESGTTT